MRVTEGLRLCAIVGAFSLFGAGAARAAEVTRFSANGSMATHNSFDGSASLDMSVTRNDKGSSSTTNLFFNKQTCDFSGCSGTFGFGTIPNGDFIIGGGTAKLNTNLAANPGYQVFRYDANGTTPVIGGVITMDWKVIPRQSSSNTGISTFVSGAFSNRFSGTQTSDRATTTGTFFGVPVPKDIAYIGTNKTSQIIINRD